MSFQLLLPMAVLVGLTFLVALRLLSLRAAAVKQGQVRMSYFRAMQGEAPPETAAAAGRAFSNLFEVPPLFYVACVAVLALGKVDTGFVLLAWGFVVCRVVQTLIHLSYNNVTHRLAAYLAGWLVLLGLWGRLLVLA
ncbi:MAPEG family protein [Archangium sp.]|uniref:MAPEG family protein n=1 Tax=Archangium sp. TaxID=1872627 RepID=UPI00286CDD16|nr:MAPEG family protein [Archangium sp.]